MTHRGGDVEQVHKMFDGHGSCSPSGDCLGFSFSNPEKDCSIMTHGGFVRSTALDIADARSRPTVHVGYITSTGDFRDLPRADPLPYHGSDHFRATACGAYIPGSAFPEIRSGSEGLNAVILVRDRRTPVQACAGEGIGLVMREADRGRLMAAEAGRSTSRSSGTNSHEVRLRNWMKYGS
ncbi:hypothetical protein [Sphingobium sp. Sx8-8]|uniref:hypothetical protein n=1 Tax=Sphingobium sp. Sx8-8 TaxID=2933617 RepID=UPI001F59BD39|nr:hypothetical protein [Sphingobium sp. Sx8-8]